MVTFCTGCSFHVKWWEWCSDDGDVDDSYVDTHLSSLERASEPVGRQASTYRPYHQRDRLTLPEYFSSCCSHEKYTLSHCLKCHHHARTVRFLIIVVVLFYSLVITDHHYHLPCSQIISSICRMTVLLDGTWSSSAKKERLKTKTPTSSPSRNKTLSIFFMYLSQNKKKLL